LFTVLLRSDLLNFANTIYLVIFKYILEERLELFLDNNINAIELEAAVVRQLLALLALYILNLEGRVY